MAPYFCWLAMQGLLLMGWLCRWMVLIQISLTSVGRPETAKKTEDAAALNSSTLGKGNFFLLGRSVRRSQRI